MALPRCLLGFLGGAMTQDPLVVPVMTVMTTVMTAVLRCLAACWRAGLAPLACRRADSGCYGPIALLVGLLGWCDDPEPACGACHDHW